MFSILFQLSSSSVYSNDRKFPSQAAPIPPPKSAEEIENTEDKQLLSELTNFRSAWLSTFILSL